MFKEPCRESVVGHFFVIFWTYSLYIGNRLPYRESVGNALTTNNRDMLFYSTFIIIIKYIFLKQIKSKV
jgi:hypothetical protein